MTLPGQVLDIERPENKHIMSNWKFKKCNFDIPVPNQMQAKVNLILNLRHEQKFDSATTLLNMIK